MEEFALVSFPSSLSWGCAHSSWLLSQRNMSVTWAELIHGTLIKLFWLQHGSLYSLVLEVYTKDISNNCCTKTLQFGKRDNISVSGKEPGHITVVSVGCGFTVSKIIWYTCIGKHKNSRSPAYHLCVLVENGQNLWSWSKIEVLDDIQHLSSCHLRDFVWYSYRSSAGIPQFEHDFPVWGLTRNARTHSSRSNVIFYADQSAVQFPEQSVPSHLDLINRIAEWLCMWCSHNEGGIFVIFLPRLWTNTSP